MKKARALSTICISLAASPLAAQVPGAGQCFTHQAAAPGAAALRLWFYDADLNDPESRMVIVQARMAQPAEQVLTSTLFCEGTGCFVECDGGGFQVRALPDGLEIATDHLTIGMLESCGGSANLAEAGPARFRFAAAPAEACADLAHAHPLPEPGCYGAAFARADDSGTVAAVTLRLEAPDLGAMRPAFPWLEGVLSLDLAPRLPIPDLAGMRVLLPVWCAADSGRCVSGPEDAVLDFTAGAEALVLAARSLTLYGEGEAPFDLAAGRDLRFALVPLDAQACSELELE